jgi:DNA invertase Pin-like site-specific DNA recombinase
VIVGYARVSTPDQDLKLQRDALERFGCERVFTDVASGTTKARPGLLEALEFVRRGDTLAVWRLDRFGRSLPDLIERVTELQARGVNFVSLQEQLDTTTANGVLVFHIFGAMAQFERELIRERTHAGLTAARARGKLGGRPKALDDKRRALVLRMYADKSNSVREICEAVGISRATLYRVTKLTS